MAKTYRPEDLATELGVSGKVVRAFLRKTFARPAKAKGSTWVLSQAQANAVRKHFRSLNPKATAKPKANAKRTPKATANAAPRKIAAGAHAPTASEQG